MEKGIAWLEADFINTSLGELTPKINRTEWIVFWKVNTGEYGGLFKHTKEVKCIKYLILWTLKVFLGFVDHRSNKKEKTRASL